MIGLYYMDDCFGENMKAMQTTITTGRPGHGFETGYVVEIVSLDKRKWKRLLHFLTFRSPPMRKQVVTIKSTSETTLELVTNEESP